nr:hypothetical protein CIT39_14580 [Bradyrhizobium symbiodeficiens]
MANEFKPGESTRTGEDGLRHAEAVNIEQRRRNGRRWHVQIIWAVAVAVAMLGWISAIGWVVWKMVQWLFG